MPLRVLVFDSGDPKFDLAFEEALARLRAKDRIPDTLRIWRTSRSVVLGYFRSPEEDVHLDVASRNGIPLIRRFTGGGTVYLDGGCLNYSIVMKRKVEFPISYLYGTVLKGTLAALKSLGFSPYLMNTNDVVVNGKKVSGTAASIKWDVLFLHGSVLVDANLKRLKSLLRTPKRIKPTIDPVKYRVANLTDFVDVEHKDVVSSLIHGYSMILSSEYYLDRPTGEEIKIARVLHRWRYSRGDWNMKKALRINGKEIEERIKEILN